MDTRFEDVIVKEKREIWQDSDSEFDSEEYEIKQVEQEIAADERKNIEDYNEQQDLIFAICKDMKKKDPKMNDELNKLMEKLKVSAGIVDKIQKGGLDSTRLSQLEKRVETKQGNFNMKQIRERLKNFTKVKVDELFEIPNGVWVRYFLKDDEGKRGLYRTGGIMIHKDPEKRYVTLKSIHNPNSRNSETFTWNLQIDAHYSVYVTTKNVKTFRLSKMDKKHGFMKGTTNMLSKWFDLNEMYVELMKNNNRSIHYVLYDTMYNKLYVPNRNEKTNKKLLAVLGISQEEFVKQLMMGLKKQITNPLKKLYIVGLIKKDDVPKLKKMKSRLKEH